MRIMESEFPRVLNVISQEADALAAPIRAAVAKHGAAGEVEWLAENYAFDIAFMGDGGLALADAKAVAEGAAADINVVKQDCRRKRLLIADMDSTIISCECLDELADMAGLKPKIAAITERAMRGEIQFEPALRERVGLLKGLELDALEHTWRERVRLNPGAKTLLATMKNSGAKALLVSGGFTYFTSRVAAEAGFDEDQANILLDDGSVLTGEVAEPILGREAKLDALENAVSRFGLSQDDALAVGDGANDLAMIGRAGLGVAYHAKPIVAAAAGAAIQHGDLTALLYLQGYRKSEFVIA